LQGAIQYAGDLASGESVGLIKQNRLGFLGNQGCCGDAYAKQSEFQGFHDRRLDLFWTHWLSPSLTCSSPEKAFCLCRKVTYPTQCIAVTGFSSVNQGINVSKGYSILNYSSVSLVSQAARSEPSQPKTVDWPCRDLLMPATRTSGIATTSSPPSCPPWCGEHITRAGIQAGTISSLSQ
jgi:hypothetical protein